MHSPCEELHLTEKQCNYVPLDQMDTTWERDPGFVLYDFNKPEDIPAELHGTFAMVVIDPPFIIKDVWEKYTKVSDY